MLTTNGLIAILNERMFLLTEFGASLIGIDMFDRGNVTGQERATFQDFLAFALFGMDGVDADVLEKVLEVEVAINDMRDFRDQLTHTKASLDKLLDMIKNVQRLLKENYPHQASQWKFSKFVYMQTFVQEIILCGAARNIDTGQWERLAKHFTQYYTLTNHNPYDLPRQVHIRYDEECAVNIMCLAFATSPDVIIHGSTLKGLMQRAEADKTAKAGASNAANADFEPVGLAFPLKNCIRNYRTLLGYPQVSASIYRNPTDVYHANQPQLKFVEYRFKKSLMNCNLQNW